MSLASNRTESSLPRHVPITLKSPLSYKGEDTAETCVLVSSDYYNKMPHTVYFSHFLQVQDKRPRQMGICQQPCHSLQKVLSSGWVFVWKKGKRPRSSLFYVFWPICLYPEFTLWMITILGDKNTIYEFVRGQISRPQHLVKQHQTNFISARMQLKNQEGSFAILAGFQ